MATYIRIKGLASRPGFPGKVPVTAPTIWRWCKAGTFPKPVKINRTTVWSVEEVDAFLAAKASGEVDTPLAAKAGA
jgi:predicted DNA-binding transcriptional regulator AlpA